MSSYEKNLNARKFILKQGNKLLSLSNNNNQPILLNNISNSINENQLIFPNINSNINKLNLVDKNRQKDNNNQEKKILTEISKIYSLSKPKNENKIRKLKNSKFKLSKVILDSNIDKSKILESFNNSNIFKLSEMDLANSRNVNANKNISNNNNITHKKINIYDNIDEIRNNDSYCNNLLNINKINNSNLAKKRGSIGYSFLKLDTDNLNTPKENKIKLDLPNDDLGKKLRLNIMKNDIFGTPSGPLRKKYAIFTSNNTPENKMRFTLDKISKKIIRKDNKLKKIDNINNRILTIKPNKNAYIITETIGNLDYRDSHSIKKNFTIDAKESENLNKSPLMQKKKIKVKKCPEDLHFYYVGLLQEAKKEGSELEEGI
jgi:hypothetical protein